MKVLRWQEASLDSKVKVKVKSWLTAPFGTGRHCSKQEELEKITMGGQNTPPFPMAQMVQTVTPPSARSGQTI